MILILSGVCGSGKTSCGLALADKLGCRFAEADEFHPPENIAKMSQGTPLTDSDRLPWLLALRAVICDWSSQGLNGVITCSALKRSYRLILQGRTKTLDNHHDNDRVLEASGAANVVFILLTASEASLRHRMTTRRGHFMPLSLLATQLATLELPAPDEAGIHVLNSENKAVTDIVEEILESVRGEIDFSHNDS